jgi:hypothetical protein
MEEHEKKLKLLKQNNGCVSNAGEIKCSETAKDSLMLDGNKLSPCKTSTTRSCNVICCKPNTACNSEKNKLNKSSTDSDVVVAMDMRKTLQSISKVWHANVNNNTKLDSATPVVGRSNFSLGATQYERSVSLSNGISCAGVSFAGHIDGIVKQFDVLDLVSGEKNVCRNGISSKNNLNQVNSDSEKKGCTGLSIDLSQEYSVGKLKSRHLLNKQSYAAGLSKSRGVFSLHSWNSAVSTQPIESDEWLAFLQHTMEEVMDGDVDALQQCNFVGVVVSPLRNPGASCRVVEYVACLLSLPFVVNNVTEEEVSKIQQVIGIYMVSFKFRGSN